MRYIPSLLFFSFICWIIVLADTDNKLRIMRMIEGVPFGDKVGHFVLYGLLASLINIALRFRRIMVFKWDVNLSGLIVLSFAITEEFTQLAFVTRTFDLGDIAGDVLGVWFFVFLSEWVWRKTESEVKRTK